MGFLLLEWVSFISSSLVKSFSGGENICCREMRIRKRQLSFSLSSDPQFNRPPVVQLPPLNNPPHPSSDRPNPLIGDSINYSEQDNCLVLKSGETAAEEERGEVERRSNDTRKKSILGAEVPPSGSGFSQQAVERWYGEEKAFPLKKRRGSLEETEKDNKKESARMKTKMNKKCVQEHDNGKVETKPDNVNVTPGAKKRGRGGALMEGSRCSRVNGRGWRCCQQTLVGYSLCEHHLGKGRLRSMSSVRSRSLAVTSSSVAADRNEDSETISIGSSSLLVEKKASGEDGDGNFIEDEEKPRVMITKKKTKLGVVKARSINSLLGQTINPVLACIADDNK